MSSTRTSASIVDSVAKDTNIMTTSIFVGNSFGCGNYLVVDGDVSPRKAHAAVTIANAIYDHYVNDGVGATFNANGDYVKFAEGYVIGGLFPTLTINLNDLPEIVMSIVRWIAELESDVDYFGYWLHGDTLYVDAVEHVMCSEATAVAHATARGELAIFDCANNVCIDCACVVTKKAPVMSSTASAVYVETDSFTIGDKVVALAIIEQHDMSSPLFRGNGNAYGVFVNGVRVSGTIRTRGQAEAVFVREVNNWATRPSSAAQIMSPIGN